MIEIPANLAKGHGGDDAAMIGAKWAETFEIVGGLKGTDTVLDIGCGPGRMALSIGERFNWTTPYFGFDVRKQDIRFCAQNITASHPNFRFAHLDIHNGLYNPGGKIAPHEVVFPAEPGSIDFAFATSVFTHMFRREVEHYIRQAFTALRPGGTLFSTWFILPEAGYQGAKKARFDFSTFREDGTAMHTPGIPEKGVAFSLEAGRQCLTDAGFDSVTFVRGAWAGDRGARHSQDILVARRPR